MGTVVLFAHGAGEGAYEEDGLLVASLRDALGASYEVRYPKMPLEESAQYADWTARIASALPPRGHEVVLVGHSVGGSVLLEVPLREARRGICQRPLRDCRAVLGCGRFLGLG